MNDMFRVGVITTTHGVKGEVKVYPTTDDPMRFKKIKKVLLDNGKEQRELEITSARFFKNLVILKFKGIDNINEVEKYRQADLYVTRDKAIPLEEDEYYVADLIGMTVVMDEGTTLGELTDVLSTGANDVYEVSNESGKTIMIPAIHDCILDVDMQTNVMKVHLLPGLLDL